MENYAVFIIIFIVIELLATFFLLKYANTYKLIKNTETSSIATVRNGFYEIKGRVVSLQKQFISPFSEKECVYYHFRVQQKKSRGKSSSFVTVIDDKKSQKFGVDDGSGVAIIDPAGADVKLKMDTKESSGIFDKADQKEERALEKYGHTSKGLLFQKTLRYREKFLEVGDLVYVLGEVNSRENSQVVFKRMNQKLFVSDKSENELLEYYKIRIIAIFVAMATAAALCYYLYSRLG